MKRQFKYIGELPKGDWQFCLVSIAGKPDVIVIADLNGGNPPRMIVDGKLLTLIA